MSRFAFICILFLLSLKIHAQDNQCIQKLSAFVENINTFTHLYPQEKVYLHFDNTGYYLGENIWFKAYVVVAENNQPTVLSRVLYVELLSPDGYVLETKKLKIENGQCDGDFFLKTDQYGGFYEVRAYTRLMLNQEETVFSRVFPVFDSPKKEGDYNQQTITELPHSMKAPSQRKALVKEEKVNIQFFPEGGNLINGLNSRVTFKATDSEGRGIDITGTLLNEKKESITSFSTMHNGMGYFTFTPENTSSYTINLWYEGKDYSFRSPFKDLVRSGYTMTVDNLRSETLLLQLQKGQSRDSETLGLSFSCRGKVHVFEVVDMTTQSEYLLKISKASLPTGVNQITLFTSAGEILSERLVFINHKDQPAIATQQSKSSYKPFENIELEFFLTDKENNPVQGNTFSVSVRDAAASPIKDKGSLFTDLLLSSDLKGHIEDADYYFESDDNKHQLALDLLMMTQGWRRYSWKQMAGVEPFELKHHMEKGIVIDGQVLSVFRKKIKENLEVKMWMYSEDGTSQQGVCMTDEEGWFNFLPQDFTGKADLSLQTAEKGKRKESRILLNRQFTPEARSYSYLDEDIILNKNLQETISYISNQEDSLVLNDKSTNAHILPVLIVEETNRRNPISVKYDVEESISKIEDKGEDYAENLPLFLFKTNKYFNYTSNVDVDSSSTSSIPTLCTYKGKLVSFLVNGVPIEETPWRNIDNLYVSEVKTIEIHEQYLDRGASIFFYTQENKSKLNEPKGIRLTHLQGYSENSKEFYSPDYSNGVLPDEKDYRRTLYWNPNVKTDNQGKASVRFYNNGSCKQMFIRAETVIE